MTPLFIIHLCMVRTALSTVDIRVSYVGTPAVRLNRTTLINPQVVRAAGRTDGSILLRECVCGSTHSLTPC